MSDDTWRRYCEALEEMRRVQDETRKRRKAPSEQKALDEAADRGEDPPTSTIGRS